MLSVAGALPDTVLSLGPVVRWLFPATPVPFWSFGMHLGAAECHQVVPTPGGRPADGRLWGGGVQAQGRQAAGPTQGGGALHRHRCNLGGVSDVTES